MILNQKILIPEDLLPSIKRQHVWIIQGETFLALPDITAMRNLQSTLHVNVELVKSVYIRHFRRKLLEDVKLKLSQFFKFSK